MKLIKGKNDFQTLYPEVAKEWHPSLNGGEKPSDFMPGSGYRAWWKCSVWCHEWQTRILHRRNGVGCPECGKKKASVSRRKNLLTNVSSFAEEHPEMLAEWEYELNSFGPNEISRGSNKKIYWKCLKGHPSYLDTINHRLNGRGCPVCSGHKIIPGINDLESNYPKIAKTWHPTKNGDLKPSMVGLSGHNNIWWVCEKGHEYQSLISSRIRGQNCPYCSNHKVLPGFNDLETLYPDLAMQWHPTKNGNLKPSDIVPGSHVKRWWLCPRCSNEWESAPHTRIGGTGCPKCSSERQTSFPEQAILFYLNKVTKAESRTKLAGAELDIYLPELNVGIEYDGILYHSSNHAKAKEERKNKHFEALGVRLIRVKEVIEGKTFEDSDVIYYRYSRRYLNLDEPIKLITNLIGIRSPKVNIDNDEAAINANYLTIEKENSILVKRPEIASEWDYEANKGINPDTISYTSGKRIHWICSKGHKWVEDASHRYRGHNCPYCSGHRVLEGFNDVATTHPEAAYFWDTDNLVRPEEASFGSEKKVNLRCPVCGHKWKTGVWYIVKNPKCPKCKHSIKK